MDLTKVPSLPPPAGVTSNFINPESQALMVTVICIICLILVTVISALRFYTNIWIKKSLKIDDIVCAFAVAGSIAYTAVVLSCMNVAGRHQWDVPILPDGPAFVRKMIIAVDMLYGPIVFNAKLSLFLLYYRLFAQHKWMRNWVYLGIGITALLYSSSTVVYGILCIPRRGQSWLDAVFSSRCHKQYVMIGYVRGPFNLFSDIFLLFLPLPAIWQLQMPLRKKIGIMVIFLTGSFACIASCFGIYFRVQLYKSLDLTWNLAPVVATVVIELNVGTICASLPFLPAFYHRHHLKPSQAAALATFRKKMNPFKSSQRKKNHYLTTGILGSVEGEGKFLQSGYLTNVTGTTDTSQLTMK